MRKFLNKKLLNIENVKIVILIPIHTNIKMNLFIFIIKKIYAKIK